MLSIIIIAYNEEKYIPQILESLRLQTFKNFEVIISDSNSTDNTKNAAIAFKQYFNEFKYLKLDKAAGPAYGRNKGADHAKYERLLFLDSDTKLKNDFIEKTLKEINRKKIDIATCPIKISEHNFISDSGAFFLNSFMLVLRPFYPTAFGACFFSTKNVHKKIGGFNENLGICEDCNYVKTAAKTYNFKFKILKPCFYTSDRRAAKEGNIQLTLKYLKTHLYRIFTGKEILKGKINYNYGKFN
ncbi:MAG: glycosyltransferase family 2 protein [Desulforegulaceae bacterium]|jgi:glycosyltransferase involved in cell wall biosynthesis|nr:glycosyltransferase family 2 protein [Desulforegulaceae bacterium]